MEKIREKQSWAINGFSMIPVFVGLVYGIWRLFILIPTLSDSLFLSVFTLFLIGATFFMFGGFVIVQPNEAKVLVCFGNYAGTLSNSGFWWVNPFTIKRNVSLKIHNLNSEMLKVNDLTGNPIEIAAVVVWRVVDSAKALFDVEDYQEFVKIQCETAIRALATEYPYDTDGEKKHSLRGNQSEVAENLRSQVQDRLNVAGIEILETRISHLAYAPEIAQVMLRRQQAEAIISARRRIVEGAVGMVEMAIKMLGEKKLLTLDDEKQAAMTNNLLVALVSEHEVTPIVNTGTLYS